MERKRRGRVSWRAREPRRPGQTTRAARLRGLAFLGLWLSLPGGAMGAAETFAELEVRAVYLYNFAAFVEWPPTAFASSSSPIRYCVAGNRGLLLNLERVLTAETLGGRTLELVAVGEDPARWEPCHLLYVDHGFQHLVPAMFEQLSGRPVLTVGDSETFASRGGMIGLVRRGGRLRTFINRAALARVGIRLSSKLLRLSTLILDKDAPSSQ
ncbi:YfiR family protein [Thiocystis violacea]|uniref:YfiR family protein n=1 Tax=Thiocystis violacea TaxID=13725 RepID=UPI0019057748|nr:YfiR family protein [Thiocystis violacea]MBK1719507.1 hypothetical protein [Thiocystis violacea]